MGLPGSQHSTYNPVNHTGDPNKALEAAVRKVGGKYATAAAAKSNLHGGACVPKADACSPENKTSTRPDTMLHLPARVDHLSGTACIPSSSRSLPDSSSTDGTNASDHSKSTATQAKIRTLRAAVDHLSGEGCTVRQVDVVATLDAPPPTMTRGMATRLVRDRQIARAAHEHNMSSCLYEPGRGYTKVIAGAAATPEGQD